MTPDKPQPIRPTLYIGLGGTGKEVLLRLRRRFYERFRTGSIPCTRFLWIDTDTRDVDARGEELDVALRAVAFEEHEKIKLLDGSVGKDAIDIFRNRNKWSYIHDWLYDEVERFGVEIADGAGGVRAVGRLMFMVHFDKVEQALRRFIGELRQQDTFLKTQDFYRNHGLGDANLDPSGLPMVCVVCSVAGGTGAGTLLDLTFLLRHLEQIGHKTEGIATHVFLPNVYYADPRSGERASRSYGNAYAALKELDHFSLRLQREGQAQGGGLGVDFNVTWEDRTPLRVMGPPAKVTYLLEMANTAGVSLSPDNRRELFSMVAEGLYLDLLPSPFASAKRSDYSNIVMSLSGPAGVNSVTKGINLPQTFSRRYATYGLSKIEVPQDMLRAACSAQLSADILANHVLRALPDPNVGMEVRDDLAQSLLDRDGIPSLFGTEWKALINKAVEDAFRSSSVTNPSEVDELGRKLEDLEKKMTYALGNDKVRWGDSVKHLRNSGATVTEDAKKRLDALLRVRALENPARGPKTALREGGYIDECIAGLKLLGAPEEAGVVAVFPQGRADAERDAEHNKQIRTGLLDEIKEAMRGYAIRLLGVSSWTHGVLLARLKEAARQVLLCQAEAVLFAETNKTALTLVKALEQRRKDLQRFLESAEIVANDGRARADALQHVESINQILILRLYDRQQHWGAFYCLDQDPDSGESLPIDSEKEYRRFVQGLGPDTGILELAALVEKNGRPGLAEAIDQYCDTRFTNDFHAHARAVDVLEHPLMKSRPQEYLQRLVNAALPMLRQERMLGSMKAPVDHVAYIGVADAEAPKYKRLATEIGQLLKARLQVDVQLQSTGNPSEIYLYLSDYAFSLPLLPIVTNDAHRAYWDFYESSINQTGGNPQQLVPLHLSKRWEGKFEDLVVYSDGQAETLRDTISIIIFGHVLKVLVLKETRGTHSYHYMLGRPFGRLEPLGPRRQVIASLIKDSRLRKTFEAAIAKREAELSAEQLLGYHLAVQAASYSPDLVRSTPDDVILGKKLSGLLTRGGVPAHQHYERIRNVDEASRFEFLRGMPDSGIEWVLDSYPTVAGLAVWERPSDA